MTTRYSKIVVPLDGSPFAEHILSHLRRLATPANTELVLIQSKRGAMRSVPRIFQCRIC